MAPYATLCLLAILLHPEPPSLVAIEEPELGLHPDVVAQVAELLVKCLSAYADRGHYPLAHVG